MTTFRKHPAHLLTLACLSLAPFLARGAFTTGNLAVFSADGASANNTTFTLTNHEAAARPRPAVVVVPRGAPAASGATGHPLLGSCFPAVSRCAHSALAMAA